MATYWIGPAVHCDICKNPFERVMYDIKTNSGPWGLLCTPCMKAHTNGQLGTGMGQRYHKTDDGKWLKVAG